MNCWKSVCVSVYLEQIAQSVQRLPTGWTVRGSNPGWVRFSAPVQTGPEAHPVSCTMLTGSFRGVRCGRGVTLTPDPLLVPRSKIQQSYTSTLPKGLYHKQFWYQFSRLFKKCVSPFGRAHKYEGWNFNSGNYLFTTDTKQIHVSKFYCPSMQSPALCTSRCQRCGSRRVT